jgi:HEAT repeat protein
MRPTRSRPKVGGTGVFLLTVVCAATAAAAQSAGPPRTPTLQEAIGQLGSIDYEIRTRASRVVRRAAPASAVPALHTAVEQHDDGYVRYRALVLLSAFNSRTIPEVMLKAAFDPNDRLRAVAYSWFERNPDPALIPSFAELLERETSEFVRPSLVAAIAAHGSDVRVQSMLLREVNRGEDFFRSAVIDALGRHAATFALDALVAIARLEGPLQDDAALALGRLGDRRALPVLAGLQRTAPREAQPAVAAGICLLKVNCETHRGFLTRTLAFAEAEIGFQPLLRGAATGLAALAAAGDADAARALIDTGIRSDDPVRAPVALAVASIAVQNPMLVLDLAETTADRSGMLTLLLEGFDMLEEDYAEEQFFGAIRRAHWAAPEGSARRSAAEALIGRLDF